MAMDFSDIVERSRALRSLQEAATSKLTDNIPHLERGLSQIDFESRRLLQSNAAAGGLPPPPPPGEGYHPYSQQQQELHQQSNARALRLLSEYGYETDKIETTLQSVALMDAFEPIMPAVDTDVHDYLERSNELVITRAFDSTIRRAKSRSLASLADSIDVEWDVSKRDALHHRDPLSSHAHSHAPGSRRGSLSNAQGGSGASTLQVFASPFRQPRSTRQPVAHTYTPGSSLTPSRAAAFPPRSANRRHSAFLPPKTAATSSPPRAPASAPSIYYDMVRRVVYSGCRPRGIDALFSSSSSAAADLSVVNTVSNTSNNPGTTPSGTTARTASNDHGRGAPRIATELDDCLVEHFAPRGDPLVASKSVQHLHAIFNALRYITGEHAQGMHTGKPSSSLTSSLSTTAATATATPSPTTASVGVVSLGAQHDWPTLFQLRVVRGARQFLCLQFREDKMRREVEQRPVEARRGGVPGVRADVRAYLNLVFDRGVPDALLRDGAVVDGAPLWAFVYYLLRAGHDAEALSVVDEVVSNGCIQSSVELYARGLRAVVTNPGHALPLPLLEALVQHYGVAVKHADDPYQRVCYVLLMRLDPAAGDKLALLDDDYALLFYSVEDYLWLRLSIARIPGVDTDALPPTHPLAPFQTSLPHIAAEMRAFGPAHFNPHGDAPLFYALVLVLCGQFAPAVSYLEQKARAVVEAVHIAFALHLHGFLHDTAETIVSTTTRSGMRSAQQGDDGKTPADCVQLDYAALMWRYAASLCDNGHDPAFAAAYVFSVANRRARATLVKRLLLQCRGQYDSLLGRGGIGYVGVGVGGGGGGGLIEQLWNANDYDNSSSSSSGHELERDGGDDDDEDSSSAMDWRDVVVQAGEEAERKGERDDALQLYEIGGVDGKIMAIHLSRVSAHLVVSESTPPPTTAVSATASRTGAAVCSVGTGIGSGSGSGSGLATRAAVVRDAVHYLEGRSRNMRAEEDDESRRMAQSLGMLVRLARFFDAKRGRRYRRAVAVVHASGLLPGDDAAVVRAVRTLSYGSGGEWADAVVERVPDVMVAAMECVAKVLSGDGNGADDEDDYEGGGSANVGGLDIDVDVDVKGSIASDLTALRKWARCIVNLSGMMKNVSADMSARLVNLEVVIN